MTKEQLLLEIDKLKFRPSEMSDLMSGATSGTKFNKTALGVIGSTMMEKIFQRPEPDQQSKYTMKGILLESESLADFNKRNSVFAIKPDDHIENGYFSSDGCDGIDGIDRSFIVEIKNRYSLGNFIDGVLNGSSEHKHQIQCYLDLYNVDRCFLVNNLYNTPEALIQDEIRSNIMYYDLRAINLGKSQEQLEIEREDLETNIRNSLTYYNSIDRYTDQVQSVGELPELSEQLRFHQRLIEKDDDLIDKMKQRIVQVRDFLKVFVEDVYVENKVESLLRYREVNETKVLELLDSI
jgi:hypothetical protein